MNDVSPSQQSAARRPVVAVVVPCYNEEEVLPETAGTLKETLQEMIREGLIAAESYVLFVDDGSRDRTWSIISDLASASSTAAPSPEPAADAVHSFARPAKVRFYGLKLAKNAGHQAALFAGYLAVRDRADAAISIDADLQDDVAAMREMVQKFLEGYDVVYGVRRARAADSWFKRTTARGFYRLMRWMGVDLVYDHADYRLLSRRALEALARFREVNLFLRGIVPLVGFRTTRVYYDRRARLAGESKYPLQKMIAFAVEGITSFSIRPIRLVTFAGFAVFGVSLIALLYTLYSKFLGHAETGWTSLMLSIWFIGGMQLIGIGLIGEYIGKIYLEVKDRPRYIVETALLPRPKEDPGEAAEHHDHVEKADREQARRETGDGREAGGAWATAEERDS